MKENIKAPRHWPLCGEFTGTGEFPAQRASNAENVSIWWRHHENWWFMMLPADTKRLQWKTYISDWTLIWDIILTVFFYRGAIKWNVNLMSNRFSAIRVFMCTVIQYVTFTNAKPCDINDGQQWSVQLISANILWRLCTQIQLSYNIWLREVPFISRASPWIIVVHGGKTGRRNNPYFFPGACLVNLLAPGRFVWNLCK